MSVKEYWGLPMSCDETTLDPRDKPHTHGITAVPHGITCHMKPFAWVRFGSDGRIEGPILDTDERICDIRRKEWTPLHLPVILK
jgi:hypothetical protein